MIIHISVSPIKHAVLSALHPSLGIHNRTYPTSIFSTPRATIGYKVRVIIRNRLRVNKIPPWIPWDPIGSQILRDALFPLILDPPVLQLATADLLNAMNTLKQHCCKGVRTRVNIV